MTESKTTIQPKKRRSWKLVDLEGSYRKGWNDGVKHIATIIELENASIARIVRSNVRI